MGTLSERISSLGVDDLTQSYSYMLGFQKARVESATLAAEADELIEKMESILESASVGAVVIDSAKDVLDELDKWKERTK